MNDRPFLQYNRYVEGVTAIQAAAIKVDEKLIVHTQEPKTLQVIRTELDENDSTGGDRPRPT